MYDELLDLHHMQQAIQTIPSVKFERRKEKQKLPAFLSVYRNGLMKCAEAIWAVSLSGQVSAMASIVLC